MAAEETSTERTILGVLDELDDMLQRIDEAAHIVLETGIEANDGTNNALCDRLSFCARIILESAERASKCSDEALILGRKGMQQ